MHSLYWDLGVEAWLKWQWLEWGYKIFQVQLSSGHKKKKKKKKEEKNHEKIVFRNSK